MKQHFESLDETIRAIKADCEAQIKAMSDRLMAAEIEATMAKSQLQVALQTKEEAIKISERLVTQFDIVEKVFADAKAYALEIRKDKPKVLNAEQPE